MSIPNNAIALDGSLKYDSGVTDLYATVRRDLEEYKSSITVTWEKTSVTIAVEGFVEDIHWRPNTASFICLGYRRSADHLFGRLKSTHIK